MDGFGICNGSRFRFEVGAFDCQRLVVSRAWFVGVGCEICMDTWFWGMVFRLVNYD